MKENKNIILEKEEFELRREYAKELHSNESSIYTLGCLLIMAVFALGMSEISRPSFCVKKGQMDKKVLLAKSDTSHSRE